MSSNMRVAPLALDPRQHFGLPETPVLSKPVTWYSPQGSLSRASIDPRHRNLQQLGYFVDSQKVAFVSSSLCGRRICGIVWRSG